MHPERIGIAGYMGSGKSTAAHFFSLRGWTIIDADREAKNLMASDGRLFEKLKDAFGKDITDDEVLSFARLGNRAFASPESLRLLNSIVHPPLLSLLKTKMTSAERMVLDAALIPLWHIEEWFDCRIWIAAPFKDREDHLIKKNPAMEKKTLAARMRLQEEIMPAPDNRSWLIINNSGSINTLKTKLPRLSAASSTAE